MKRHDRARRRQGSFDHLESRNLLSIALLPLPVAATQGVPFSGQVATFNDPGASASDFNSPPGSVLISWGDGTPAGLGLVVESSTPGQFDVEGLHVYSQAATFTTGITVADQAGDTGTASGQAVVSAAQPLPSSASPLTVAANAIRQPAGQSPAPVQTVATFVDPNAADTRSDFTALIDWGDGHSSIGNVQGGNRVFTVNGSNTYASAGSYTFTVNIVGTGGAPSGSASGSATVLSVIPAASLTGGLAPVSSNGPHAAAGFTNTNRPTFSGTATPFSIVQLDSRHFNVDAVLPIGETVADSTGHWTLAAGPLAVGTYVVSATVTPPGGYPSTPTTLTNQDGGDLVYIDLTPRLVRWLSHEGAGSVTHHRHHHSRPGKR